MTTTVKVLKWTGIGLLIALLLIVPVFYAIIYFMSGEIKEYAEKQIGKSFTTEVKFDKLDISLFKAFPKVSIRFNNFSVEEAGKISGRKVFKAGELSLAFNVWDILNKRYKFRQILLEDAYVNLVTDKKGRNNFDVMRHDTGAVSKEEKPIKAELKKVLLSNCHLHYENKKEGSLCDYKLDDMVFSGDFDESHFAMAMSSEGTLEKFSSGGNEYLSDKFIKLDGGMEVNLKEGKYSFTKTRLSVANLGFSIKGDIKSSGKSTRLDLAIDGDEMDIQSFLSLVPPSFTSAVKGYESEGTFYFRSTIRGQAGNGKTPDIRVDFGISDATISKQGIELPLKQVNLKGSYNNTTDGGYIKVTGMKAKLAGKGLDASLELKNFDDPHLNIDLSGAFDMPDVQRFIMPDSVSSMTGSVNMDVHFNGRLSDLEDNSTVSRVSCTGNIDVKDVGINFRPGRPAYKNLNARLQFTQNDLAVHDLSGHIGGSDFRFSGVIENLTSYLLLPNQRIRVDGSFHSDRINASEMLQHNTSSKKDTAALNVSLPANVDLDFALSCKHFEFYRFKATDFSGKVTLNNRQLKAEQVKFNAMGGSLTLNARATQQGRDILTVARITSNEVSITDLFYQCNNFGQKEITDKNLSGRLKSDITFTCLWNSSLVADLDELYTFADLQITNGELRKYEPLKALSKFVNVNELENVRFSALKNQVEISNQTIYIPSMQVNNNALDMQVSGKHNFSNVMDYHFKIRLSELLAAKYKSRRGFNPDEIEENPKGGINLFISMTGTPDKLNIKRDKKESKENRKEEFKSEKNELRQLFREEFKRDATGEEQKSPADKTKKEEKKDEPKEKKTVADRLKEKKKKDEEQEEQMRYE